MPTEAGPDPEQNARTFDHERVANEAKHWVRLTAACNSKCVFCLDAEAQDGRFMAFDDVCTEIRRGREEKDATRLVISGGEASIHPRFHDAIRYGKSVGYRWVQTVTNGQRLADRAFFLAAMDAGLDEITFSLHGHTAALHDRLTRTKNGFDNLMKAMIRAVRDGRPVVNVDVCINRQNVEHLEAIVALCARVGVKEFDLLHVIPQGEAWTHRHELFYDPEQHRDALRRVFRLARSPQFHIWTNRFPLSHLEDMEELIQDPHKMLDEVGGRRVQFRRYLDTGAPIDCRDAERCPHCFVEPFCSALDRLVADHHAGRFDVLWIGDRDPDSLPWTHPAHRLPDEGEGTIWPAHRPAEPPARNGRVGRAGADGRHGWQGGAPWEETLTGALTRFLGPRPDGAERDVVAEGGIASATAGEFVTASTPPQLLGVSRVPTRWAGPVYLRAERYTPDVSLPSGSRVVATTLAHLEQLAAYEGEIEVHLDHEMCRYVSTHGVRPTWILHAPTRATAELSAALDPDWHAFFSALPPGYRAQNLPACLMPGARIERPLRILDAGLFHEDGRLGVDALVERHIGETYRVKSTRCGACAAFEVCEGAHIQSIRAHGFRQLRPFEGAADTVRRLTELASPSPRLRDGAPPQPAALRLPVPGNEPVPFIDEHAGRRS